MACLNRQNEVVSFLCSTTNTAASACLLVCSSTTMFEQKASDPFLCPSESCAREQQCLPQTQALPSQCSCLFLFLLPPLLVRAEISIFAHWQCGKCGSVALQDCCCFSHYIAMLGSESWSLVNVASSCSVCFSWFLVSTASFHQLL